MRFLSLCALIYGASFVPAVFSQTSGNAEVEAEKHYKVAKAAEAKQDYGTAIREWKSIITLMPSLAEAHSNLGMMYYFAHRPGEAVASFRQAIQLSPHLVVPHLFLGICSYLISRPDEAIAELQLTLQLEPSNAIAKKWLGLSYAFHGDMVPAVAALQQASQQIPEEPEIQFHLARAYTRLATDCVRTIRDTWPDSAWDHLVQADQYRLQNRTEESQRQLREADARKPGLTTFRDSPFQPVHQLLANGKYAEAYEEAVRLRTKAPSTPELLYLIARASRELGFQGIENFAHLEPDSYRLHQLRAEYEAAGGNDVAAQAEYRKVLAAKPEAIHVHLALGELHVRRKEFDQAIAEFQQELKIDPYSAAALMQIGIAYRSLGDAERAVQSLKRSIEINANSGFSQKEIGIAYLQLSNAQSAIQHLERAKVLLKGEDDTLLYQLGRAYRLANQAAKAAEYNELYRQRLQQNRERLEAPSKVGN